MLRKRAHKLLDQIPDSKLPEVIDLLNNMALGVPLMETVRIPIYDMRNPEHVKLMAARHSNKK